MTKRKELLESSRDTLKAIDAVLLESSNVSLAAKVEWLCESAAPGLEMSHGTDRWCDCCLPDDDPFHNIEVDDLFTPIFARRSEADVDALRYQAEIAPDVRIRRGYALTAEPHFDPLSGTVSAQEALDGIEYDDGCSAEMLQAINDDFPFLDMDGDETIVGKWVNIDGFGSMRWHVDSIVDCDDEVFRAHMRGDDHREDFHVSMITTIYWPED